MQKPPIGPLVTALRSLGIKVDAPTDCPPIAIRGKGSFTGGRATVDAGLSSQYVSAPHIVGFVIVACVARLSTAKPMKKNVGPAKLIDNYGSITIWVISRAKTRAV